MVRRPRGRTYSRTISPPVRRRCKVGQFLRAVLNVRITAAMTGRTLSMQASREVGRHGLQLVGNLRTSLLIGEFHLSPGIGARTDDEIQPIFEPQLGVAYTRQVGHLELSVHLLYETQFWLNDALTEIVLQDSSSILFSGPTISFQSRS